MSQKKSNSDTAEFKESQSLFVADDIHWNTELERASKKVVQID